MANLTFRQGILRHAQDSLGTQGFIDVVGNYVNLMAADEPTVVTFAHGNTDYIFSENSNFPNAWGPLNPGTQYWLYWELDKKTGARTFGFTQYSPITQAAAPTNPIVGQMWFNTIQQRMSEYTPNGWTEVIRVLACRIDFGLIPHSVSKDAPRFTGTQVGITGNVRAGGIIYDLNGYPIKKQDKTFFTTEDDFMTGLPSGASLRISNVTLTAVASMPLARHQVVEYSGFGRLKNATPYGQTEKLLGIIEHDAITGDDVSFSVEGMFFDDEWSWQTQGAEAGDHVYINETGEVALSPVAPGQYPIGIVIGPQEIMFAPAMMAKGATENVTLRFEELSNTPSTLSGYANYIIRVNSAETGIEFVQDLSGGDGTNWGEITGLVSNQTDLSLALDGKSPVVHTHTKSEITDFAHTHTMSEITDFNGTMYATTAQGALADTAIQPNDNISVLTNDAGYVTSETDPVFIGQKGQPLGVPTLDSNGKVPQEQLPMLVITNTFVVSNEPSMLALPAQTGDIAIRTDSSATFILQGQDPTIIGDWAQMYTAPVGTNGTFTLGNSNVTVVNGLIVDITPV